MQSPPQCIARIPNDNHNHDHQDNAYTQRAVAWHFSVTSQTTSGCNQVLATKAGYRLPSISNVRSSPVSTSATSSSTFAPTRRID